MPTKGKKVFLVSDQSASKASASDSAQKVPRINSNAACKAFYHNTSNDQNISRSSNEPINSEFSPAISDKQQANKMNCRTISNADSIGDEIYSRNQYKGQQLYHAITEKQSSTLKLSTEKSIHSSHKEDEITAFQTTNSVMGANVRGGQNNTFSSNSLLSPKKKLLTFSRNGINKEDSSRVLKKKLISNGKIAGYGTQVGCSSMNSSLHHQQPHHLSYDKQSDDQNDSNQNPNPQNTSTSQQQQTPVSSSNQNKRNQQGKAPLKQSNGKNPITEGGHKQILPQQALNSLQKLLKSSTASVERKASVDRQDDQRVSSRLNYKRGITGAPVKSGKNIGTSGLVGTQSTVQPSTNEQFQTHPQLDDSFQTNDVNNSQEGKKRQPVNMVSYQNWTTPNGPDTNKSDIRSSSQSKDMAVISDEEDQESVKVMSKRGSGAGLTQKIQKQPQKNQQIMGSANDYMNQNQVPQSKVNGQRGRAESKPVIKHVTNTPTAQRKESIASRNSSQEPGSSQFATISSGINSSLSQQKKTKIPAPCNAVQLIKLNKKQVQIIRSNSSQNHRSRSLSNNSKVSQAQNVAATGTVGQEINPTQVKASIGGGAMQTPMKRGKSNQKYDQYGADDGMTTGASSIAQQLKNGGNIKVTALKNIIKFSQNNALSPGNIRAVTQRQQNLVNQKTPQPASHQNNNNNTYSQSVVMPSQFQTGHIPSEGVMTPVQEQIYTIPQAPIKETFNDLYQNQHLQSVPSTLQNNQQFPQQNKQQSIQPIASQQQQVVQNAVCKSKIQTEAIKIINQKQSTLSSVASKLSLKAASSQIMQTICSGSNEEEQLQQSAILSPPKRPKGSATQKSAKSLSKNQSQGMNLKLHGGINNEDSATKENNQSLINEMSNKKKSQAHNAYMISPTYSGQKGTRNQNTIGQGSTSTNTQIQSVSNQNGAQQSQKVHQHSDSSSTIGLSTSSHSKSLSNLNKSGASIKNSKLMMSHPKSPKNLNANAQVNQNVANNTTTKKKQLIVQQNQQMVYTQSQVISSTQQMTVNPSRNLNTINQNQTISPKRLVDQISPPAKMEKQIKLQRKLINSAERVQRRESSNSAQSCKYGVPKIQQNMIQNNAQNAVHPNSTVQPYDANNNNTQKKLSPAQQKQATFLSSASSGHQLTCSTRASTEAFSSLASLGCQFTSPAAHTTSVSPKEETPIIQGKQSGQSYQKIPRGQIHDSRSSITQSPNINHIHSVNRIGSGTVQKKENKIIVEEPQQYSLPKKPRHRKERSTLSPQSTRTFISKRCSEGGTATTPLLEMVTQQNQQMVINTPSSKQNRLPPHSAAIRHSHQHLPHPQMMIPIKEIDTSSDNTTAKGNESTSQTIFPDLPPSSKRDPADETFCSINTSISSVLLKKHDTSMVEGDALLEQINTRMMKLHFEMIYKNKEKSDEVQMNDYSFEIEHYNNLVVPKNMNEPIQNLNFVQLPNREDLYLESHSNCGVLQWKKDQQTVRLVPTSPVPYDSPQTYGSRSQTVSRTQCISQQSNSECLKQNSSKSNESQIVDTLRISEVQSDSRRLETPFNFLQESSFCYSQSESERQSKENKSLPTSQQQTDREVENSFDEEESLELESSMCFIPIMQTIDSNRSYVSENESIASTSSIMSSFSCAPGDPIAASLNAEKKFTDFVRDKVHIEKSDGLFLLPSMRHSVLLKPTFFSISFNYGKTPKLEKFDFGSIRNY